MRDILKPSMVLFAVCLVVSVCLGFTYSITKDKIKQRAALDAENARKEVLSSADTFKELEGIDEIIKAKSELGDIKQVYKGFKDNSPSGYVFLVEKKGYGGAIEITVGIDTQGKVSGVKIGKNNETPGLGSKASDKPFKSQLMDIVPKEPLKVVKAKKTKPEEIEAISGATITSKAVVGGVQAAIDMNAELVKREGGQK